MKKILNIVIDRFCEILINYDFCISSISNKILFNMVKILCCAIEKSQILLKK